MPSIDWNQRLRDKIAGIPHAIARGKEIYASEIGRWVDTYHGGMPPGLAIAHIYYETDATYDNEGDPGLGEAGLMSVTSSFPPTVGMPPESRLVPQVNVFLGTLECQINAIRLAMKIPEVELGGADSWKLAHLAFVIGYGGVLSQVAAARGMGFISRGHVYAGLVDWVKSRGGLALQAGSQDPGKVGYRVLVVEVRWQAGQGIVPGSGGMPRPPPQPPGYHYEIPFLYLPYFSLSGGSSMLALGLLAVAGVFLYKRFR